MNQFAHAEVIYGLLFHPSAMACCVFIRMVEQMTPSCVESLSWPLALLCQQVAEAVVHHPGMGVCRHMANVTRSVNLFSTLGQPLGLAADHLSSFTLEYFVFLLMNNLDITQNSVRFSSSLLKLHVLYTYNISNRFALIYVLLIVSKRNCFNRNLQILVIKCILNEVSSYCTSECS